MRTTATARAVLLRQPVAWIRSLRSRTRRINRYNTGITNIDSSGDIGLDADYLVIEMARRRLGKDGLLKHAEPANEVGIERVLL